MAKWLNESNAPARIVIIYIIEREKSKQLVLDFVQKNDFYSAFESSDEFTYLKEKDPNMAHNIIEWIKREV